MPSHSSGVDARQASGQRHVLAHHVDQVHRQRQHQDHALDQHAVDERAQRLHVARDPVDDRTRGVAVEEAEVQPLELVEHLAAQAGHHVRLEQPPHRHRVAEVEHAAQPGHGQHQRRQDQHRGHRAHPGRRPQAQRPGRRRRRRIQRRADHVHRQPHHPQAGQAQRQQRRLVGQHRQAVVPVLPGQPEQAAQDLGVAERLRAGGWCGFCGVGHERRTRARAWRELESARSVARRSSAANGAGSVRR